MAETVTPLRPTSGPNPTGQSGRRRLLILLVLAAAAAGLLLTHRNITWHEALNPVYWWRRWRQEDLYDPRFALLMHGNRSLPEVALTFDDGPHPESRSSILETLRRFHAPATFFDVGQHIDAYPDLVRSTLAEGHAVGNHSQNHNRLDTLSARSLHREINDADLAYSRATGSHLVYLRPPGMRYNDAILLMLKRMGYVTVGYSASAADFEEDVHPRDIVTRTIKRTHNGAIILLHDYPATAAALPELLEQIRRMGYRIVSLDEMIAHLPDKVRTQATAYLARQQAEARAGATEVPGVPLKR
jgi:peptidoglycan/xylan/chitin deacetylase (PgdA/CDA1 family)